MGKYRKGYWSDREKTDKRKNWVKNNRERRNAYQREWRKKNPDKVKVIEGKRKSRKRTPEQKEWFREWQAKRRNLYKLRILEYKKKCGGCLKCGWKEHIEILQFHHRIKSEKKFSFGVGNLGNYKWEKVLKEIEKCDLLCPNCHFLIHYKETAKII